MEPLRIGVLGAARISQPAIVQAAALTGARLVAVAARDRARAEEFASAGDVERVLDSYQDVLDDPEVEAIYNPLPNGLHGPWNSAAITAGKHVLSEKPFASDAVEAGEIRDQAAGTPLVVGEAFHYLYHPVMRRMVEIIERGEIGELQHVETVMTTQAPAESDPRWSLQLAGGALMDLGCYSLHAVRMLGRLAGGAPQLVSVTGAEHRDHPGVDEWVTAELTYPTGVTATAGCNMNGDGLQMTLRVIGSKGEATAENFVLPQLDDRISLLTPADGAGPRVEHLGTRLTYAYQLEAFAAAVRGGDPFVTDADDAVANMQLIDACYAGIGLAPRPRSFI